ncbi:hypothetical protein [Moritella sp. F3]|uniref:hypothetical protein n=1 Tax=Moritella sp. F3 TaxID=2718882 RepID=UPI0018E1C189|nr:hypothetical protein [Moritella sp. F3]GIC77701.1 hypothetical protein FMO001_24280 [Moritella sp. F1]GIC82114.1 hypothetical protein FMO003_23950 [Moritella sp. F3]
MNIASELCLELLIQYGIKKSLVINQMGGDFKAVDQEGKWFNVSFFFKDTYQHCYSYKPEDIKSAWISSSETGTVNVVRVSDTVKFESKS